jgi:hypothetical protein
MNYNFTNYKIKKGEKNYSPMESWLPIFYPDGFEVYFRFNEGWSSLEEWGGDKDWNDYQKLKGLTKYVTLNNYHSAIIAFNYNKEEDHYNIFPYVNYPGKEFKIEKNHIVVKKGEIGYAKVEIKKKKVLFTLKDAHGTTLTFEYPFVKRMLVARELGTYPGGGNNSEGPYGGAAFKDADIDIDFRIL